MNWDLLNKRLSDYNFRNFGTIHIRTVIGIVVLAAILFGFFWLVRRYVVPYLGSRRAVKRTTLILYRIEVISWTVLILFSLYQLLSDSIFITSALLIVLIFAGLTFWRDFFAGIAFRLENKFQERDPVRYENYNGTLQEINQRNIRIKTDKEELVTIPFRKVSNSVFIKRQAKGKLHSSQLTLNTAGKTVEEILPQINSWLFECPWAIVNENASARIIGAGLIQVTVYAVDIDSINKTEEYLQQLIRK
jgi:small-conductance mechanosensitive channel